MIEGSGSKGTRVIERKRSVTDGQTDRRTDGQGKNNMSPPEGGRHNNSSNSKLFSSTKIMAMASKVEKFYQYKELVITLLMTKMPNNKMLI